MGEIIVFGCKGQIGAELALMLKRDGDVHALDREELDLTDSRLLRSFICGLRPRLVVNAAAYTAVDRAEIDREAAMAVNAESPRVMAEACAAAGAAFVHYSTDYVFDGRGTRPYRPDDVPAPVSVYGQTKLAGERWVQEGGAKSIILRTAWLYSLRGRNFVLAILRQAATKPELRVVNDQVGCPTWARSAARSTCEIIRTSLARSSAGWGFSGKEGVYHLTCSGQTTWFDFARRIVSLAGLPNVPTMTPVRTGEFPTAAQRPAYSVMDCSLTEHTFGVRMQRWEDALDEAMRDFTPAMLQA